VLYHGVIRAGQFGSLTPEPQTIMQCGGCGVGHLSDSPVVDYASTAYRDLVDGGSSPERFYAVHDHEQPDKLRRLGTATLRGKIVADIGCGAGSFLDLVQGISQATLAIEPATGYHATLAARGHRIFSSCKDVSREWLGTVDVAVCFSVIEHAEDPLGLLREIRAMLRPGGELLLSTPNQRDWLLEMLPRDYPAFFYRTVHRWYFDADSLSAVAEAAGFTVSEVQCVHRFDLANVLLWLRDRRPSGVGQMPVDAIVDAAFCRWLETSGRADYLYARLHT
jgi:2-polyprenyl-3-methyl-5-hydroxy-6-metoxy-1,4-benzoquinol methylase